jgi:hypothetical protein
MPRRVEEETLMTKSWQSRVDAKLGSFGTLFCVLWVCGALDSHGIAAKRERIVPDQVAACSSRPEVRPYGDINFLINPYYISGDFDGDGRNDYAVAIKGRQTGRPGIAICAESGQAVVLGADTRPIRPFSDMPGDNFCSADWTALSTEQVISRLKALRNVLPKDFHSEGILMPWEDGAGLIVRIANGYRWFSLAHN